MAKPKTKSTKLKRQIHITPVDENDKGHFYRMRKSAQCQAILRDSSSTLEQVDYALDTMVDMLLERVDPTQRNEAREMLEGPDGLSQKEFEALMGVDTAPLSQNGNGTD